MTKSVANCGLEEQIDDLVREVFPDVQKRYSEAAHCLLDGLCTKGSPLVTQLSTAVKNGTADEKGRKERVSGWLERYDFDTRINGWLLSHNAQCVKEDTQINIDLTDISKQWGGKGMEGMELGRDASTKTIRYGHTIGSAVIPGKTTSDPVIPLIFTLYEGRKEPIKHLCDLCDAVLDATDGKGILVIDREADCKALIQHLQKRSARFVIRVSHLKRKVFEGLENTPEHLSNAPGTWERQGTLPGTDGTPITVIRKNPTEAERANGATSLFLYTNIPYSTLAPKIYKLRWASETFHKDIKQLFEFEKALVRIFKRLSSLTALVVLSYHLLVNRLRGTRFFGPLLGEIRRRLNSTLHKTDRFRLVISQFRELLLHGPTPGGRPKKQHNDPHQLTFFTKLTCVRS